MSKSIVSRKFSLKGWDFWEWLEGNWSTIKEGLKVGLPFAIAWAATNNPALVGLITLGGKFLMDLGEYYIKEYTL